MSRENVALFIRELGKNAELRTKAVRLDHTADWVELAREYGFEFTDEEFRTAVSQAIGRNVTTANAVREYLAATMVAGSEELSRGVLGEVVGTSRPQLIVADPLFVQSRGR